MQEAGPIAGPGSAPGYRKREISCYAARDNVTGGTMPNDSEAQRLLAKRTDHQTSHVLHLLLSVVTAGLWIPVWILVAISHGLERNKIDAKLKKL